MPVREDIGDDVFAERLERAVVPPAVVHDELVDGPVSDLADGALLGVAAALLGVDGDAGDEHVMLDGVCEELGRGANDVRDVTRRIEDCVPAPALEHGEVALAISAQPLGLGKELGVRLAPVEEGTSWPRASASSTVRARGISSRPGRAASFRHLSQPVDF